MPWTKIMSKVAIITDLHFGARGDAITFVDYMDKFYTNTFFPTLQERGIKTILNLGDTFDRRKYINYNSLKRARQMFFDPIRDNGMIMHMLAGNHDTYYKNTNDTNSIDLLLNEYSNINVMAEACDLTVDGRKIFMLPWICSDNYEQSMERMNDTDAEICMGHLEIAGFVMHRGVKSHGGLNAERFRKFGLVYSGHYHHRNNDGHIYYLGNPYELTWADYKDPRGFHIWDTETMELEFIENPYTMFERVEYDDVTNDYTDYDPSIMKEKYVKVIVNNKSDFKKFDDFMKKIYKANPHDVRILEDFAEFQDGEIDEELNLEDTMNILTSYVDSVETTLDKEKITGFLRGLYAEAQQLESETSE